jgi:hypothetical protein
MAFGPRTVQNVPDCLRRLSITVLQTRLNHTRTDEQMLATEFGVAHALGVSLEVSGRLADRFREFEDVSREHRQLTSFSIFPNQFFDFPVVKFGLMAQDPLFLVAILAGVKEAGQVPGMLAVVE